MYEYLANCCVYFCRDMTSQYIGPPPCALTLLDFVKSFSKKNFYPIPRDI